MCLLVFLCGFFLFVGCSCVCCGGVGGFFVCFVDLFLLVVGFLPAPPPKLICLCTVTSPCKESGHFVA